MLAPSLIYAANMSVAELRTALRNLIVGQKDRLTHEEIEAACAKLGMPAPPADGTKAERLEASFKATPDIQLRNVATNFLNQYSPSASDRNRIQDIVWREAGFPEINKKVRRNIARSLDSQPLYIRAEGFDRLLDTLWILDDDPFDFLGANRNSLRARIERHVYRNPDDWSAEEFFENIGAFEASDRRFGLFLEGLASADVRPDDAAQHSFVTKVNAALADSGTELREVGTDQGYPTFSLVTTRSAPIRTTKNIIFASPVKPDLRFIDAINNDIEIVTNADKVLVYDRPLRIEGLRWRDLQQWWADNQKITDPVLAKTTLYQRLLSSLPEKSPPQHAFFVGFHRAFGKSIPDLPALIPEVWLFWDPKTVKERGPQALARFRMDFLMLLPQGVRVVIEIDGKQHYAREDGKADASRYANLMAADRELKLSGYDVFRFGAHELQSADAATIVKHFFESLFNRYRVVGS